MKENNELKECTCCHEIKDLSHFKKVRKNENRLRGVCKECLNQDGVKLRLNYNQFVLENPHLTKKCKRCQEIKLIKKFSYGNNKCRKCAHNKKYYPRKIEDRIRNRKLFKERNKERLLLMQAKTRAKRKNLEFNIEKSDIIIPEFCPVLGIKLERNNNKTKDNSPSLDKIDNNKGYIKGNVDVISWRANHVKNDGTANEHELIAIYMRENTVEDYQI